MILVTGDIHGNPTRLTELCTGIPDLTKNDTLILLGDVGANFHGGEKDKKVKERLSSLPVTVFCVHGNHEIRPETLPDYKEKEWNGGIVQFEEKYPTVLFARDGDIFDIEGKMFLVVGGAYSVDKYYRIKHGYGWWADEQPSNQTKAYIERQIKNKKIDIVLSHTCPFKYEPVEAFLDCINQATVDNSTEKWLDNIEESIEYKAWYCGHWHINKSIDKIHFLFNNTEEI